MEPLMSDLPDLSVVICTYNRPELLRLALLSLLKQSPANITYEVVVVDNNSTPATRAVVDEFVQSDARVRYVRETRQGNATSAKRARVTLTRATWASRKHARPSSRISTTTSQCVTTGSRSSRARSRKTTWTSSAAKCYRVGNNRHHYGSTPLTGRPSPRSTTATHRFRSRPTIHSVC